MKKQQKKTKEITVPVYMMNRELSWLKFNERVLNEAGNPRVPLAERLTFAAIYQSNLDEFYRVRVGTLMDQMEASEVIRENKTNMTSEEQVTAIIQATRDLDQKKAAIYEQLMGELEPYGVRLINFNRLSAEEGKLLAVLEPRGLSFLPGVMRYLGIATTVGIHDEDFAVTLVLGHAVIGYRVGNLLFRREIRLHCRYVPSPRVPRVSYAFLQS